MLSKDNCHIYFVVSPILYKEDVEAIKQGYKNRKKVVEEALLREFKEHKDEFESERLNFLCHLIEEGILDIKVADKTSNYDDDELNYLEDLYKGLMLTQNINGALQIDQAQKICKLSLEIDSRIRAGDKDVDKFLSSYDKLVKTAEFTPKNTKNAVDFDSFAEVAHWLEKLGRQNKFYDGATRDVIDDTLKNIENYNQRLYINEGGIGDEITQRLKGLQSANAMENDDNIYGLDENFNLDEYDNAGYNFETTEEFLADEEES